MIPAPAVPGRNTRNAAGENKGTVLLFLSPCFSGVQILLFPSPVSRMSMSASGQKQKDRPHFPGSGKQKIVPRW